MGGIRINAAAEMLGVSPSTLRSWERRLGYPLPRRTPGNHRLYGLDEVETLREALRETGNISSAVEVAQRRGRGPASPALLLVAFDGFDEAAAHRELEESMAGGSSMPAVGRSAGCTVPADSLPSRSGPTVCCYSTPGRRSGSRRPMSRPSSCSCVAPASACCCSRRVLPRGGFATRFAPCAPRQ